jgi:hypothetical protein
MRADRVRSLAITAALALAALAAAGPAQARAQDVPARPEQASEPGPEHGKLATSDASPVGAHTFEVEASLSPSWNLSGSGGFDHSARGASYPFSLAVTYGITDDVDVSVELAYATTFDSAYDYDPDDAVSGAAHGHGFTDTTVGARWRFLSLPDAGLDVALISDLVMPTGADGSVDRVGLSQVYWSFENALVASKDWGPLTADAEVGFSLPFGGARGDERGILFANLAGGWQVLPWLQPEVELNYQRSYQASPEPAGDLLCATGGVVAPFGKGYRVAAGAQYAAWGRHTGQFVGATLAFKWAF